MIGKAKPKALQLESESARLRHTHGVDIDSDTDNDSASELRRDEWKQFMKFTVTDYLQVISFTTIEWKPVAREEVRPYY